MINAKNINATTIGAITTTTVGTINTDRGDMGIVAGDRIQRV